MPTPTGDTSWHLVFAVTLPTLQCSMGKSYSLLCPGAFPTFLIPGMGFLGRPATPRKPTPHLVSNGDLRTSRRVLLRILEQDSDASSNESELPPGGKSSVTILGEVNVDPSEPRSEWHQVKFASPEEGRIKMPSPNGDADDTDLGQVNVHPGDSRIEWRRVTFELMNRAHFGIPRNSDGATTDTKHGVVDYNPEELDVLGSAGGTVGVDGAVDAVVTPVSNGMVKVTGRGEENSEKVSRHTDWSLIEASRLNRVDQLVICCLSTFINGLLSN